MELNRLIGERIRHLRATRLKQSGTRFGKELELYLGEPWSRQTVWEAENGQRDFRVEELFALAQAGSVSVEFFLTAEPKVRLKSNRKSNRKRGQTLKPSALIALLSAPGQPTKKTIGHIRAARIELQEGVDSLEDAHRSLKVLDKRLKFIIKEAGK